MRLIRKLVSALNGQASRRAKAVAIRNAAYRQWQDAKDRGDTRDLHHASRALRDATTQALRLELGRG